MLDYFTSGHASDSDDGTFHEEKSLESDIEDLTKLTAAAVGMATTGVGHDDTEAGSEIDEESTAHSYLVVNSVLCDTMASATATSMAKNVRASSSSSMPKQRNDYGDDSSEKSEDGWRLKSFM
ncbi:hypothetical protein LSAT2_011594, partial [Lamellibrachia satsuma]